MHGMAWEVPSTIRVATGRPLARVCLTALRMRCFPGGLPPDATGRIASQPSPGGRSLAPCRRLRTLAYLVHIEAPGVGHRVPGSPGLQGGRGDLIYLHHTFGAKVTLDWQM